MSRPAAVDDICLVTVKHWCAGMALKRDPISENVALGHQGGICCVSIGPKMLSQPFDMLTKWVGGAEAEPMK